MAQDDLWSDDEWRAAMDTADVNDLPDEDFAYIEDGGTKDSDGKTTPRSLRHFPIQDAAHVRNALARASQSPFGEKAMPKILAAAKKFGIEVSEKKSAGRVKKPRQRRSGPVAGREVRVFATEGLELRDDGSNILQLTGMPIRYSTGYLVRDMFGTFQETMHPGVVTKLLANGCDTRFLLNHSGIPMARTVSGTMTLTDSPNGLTFAANLDARMQAATDVAIAVERGDLSQMSVGMIVGRDEWADNETRDIFELSALEDVSAVTYPASPTTSIEIAQRMLAQSPVESRERVRRMWAITRDLHDGRPVEPADIDVLSDGLRSLIEADDEEVRDDEVVVATDETRAAPTPQDKGIATKIMAAHQAVSDAIHAQMADPDNATDAVDADVMNHLKNAHASMVKAMGSQAVDGAPDGVRCASCGAENRADANFCAGCGAPVVPAGELAGDTGDIGVPSTSSDGNSTSAANDNTGVRERMSLELELAEMRRQRRNRNK